MHVGSISPKSRHSLFKSQRSLDGASGRSSAPQRSAKAADSLSTFRSPATPMRAYSSKSPVPFTTHDASPSRPVPQPKGAAEQNHSSPKPSTKDTISTPLPPSSYWKVTGASKQSDMIVADPPTQSWSSQVHEDKSQETTQSEERPRMTVFQVFANAWKRIEPGGFFAQEQKATLREAPKVDVLSWNI